MACEVKYTDEFEQMAKSFKNLIDKMSTERREKIGERAQEILLGMALQELRKMRKLTQKQLADGLNLSWAKPSKMDK